LTEKDPFTSFMVRLKTGAKYVAFRNLSRVNPEEAGGRVGRLVRLGMNTGVLVISTGVLGTTVVGIGVSILVIIGEGDTIELD
jgi:hypothetical protein